MTHAFRPLGGLPMRGNRRAEMKRLLVVPLLTLMVLAPLAISAQTTKFKFNQDSEFASFNQSTDPSSSVNFSVSRNDSTRAGSSASTNYMSFNLSSDVYT